jgi:DNA-binding FadR family transcriptional regulator
LIAATGVSRTVVREAVAALRANGLVVTRQGVGAFVAETVRRPFRIEFDELRSLREVLEVMELRTGIEIEAAGLAAERATPAQLRRITECFEELGAIVRRGESAVDQDYAFHCSIAEATGNPQFKRLLEYLGRFMIPRHTIKGGPGLTPDRAYLEKVQVEHRDIITAIRQGAIPQARAAMRRHLLNSRKRYQKLAGETAGR